MPSTAPHPRKSPQGFTVPVALPFQVACIPAQLGSGPGEGEGSQGACSVLFPQWVPSVGGKQGPPLPNPPAHLTQWCVSVPTGIQ